MLTIGLAVLTLALLLPGTAASFGATASGDLPELVVDAAESFPVHAARIRDLDQRRLEHAMQVLGLSQPGPPIRLVLAAEDSSAAQNTPGWIAGYAYSSLGVAVLFPGRAPSYPDSSFDELVLHEISHVLTVRATGGQRIPRWFNEGLALYIGRSWGLEDRSRLTWTLLVDERSPLAELDSRFTDNRTSSVRAYAVAGAFVHDLLRRHGNRTASEILGGVAIGLPFPEAFLRATGLTLSQAESSFWSRHSFWYRWVPLLTSSMVLWTGITLLALLAFRSRRKRDAALLQQWEDEDLLQEDAGPHVH